MYTIFQLHKPVAPIYSAAALKVELKGREKEKDEKKKKKEEEKEALTLTFMRMNGRINDRNQS